MAAERQPRLDLLKALAIGFVVLWHLHPLYVDHAPAVAALVSTFDFEISLTAVPTFLLVSLLLFYPKVEDGARALGRRLWRLAGIFAFWTAVQIAFYVAVERALPRGSWELVFLGGPPLPRIGGSVFYYLFDLIVLTAVAFGFARLPGAWRAGVAWCVVLASLVDFEASRWAGRPIEYWQLENFVVYVPVAFYLPRLARLPRRVRFRWAFVAAYLLFAALDLALGHAADRVYGRTSIFFGALSLFSWVHTLPVRPSAKVRALARYSLGIYAIHKYWQYAALVVKGDRTFNVAVGGATIHLAALGLFLATCLLTAATIALLVRTPLKRFVL